MTDEDRWSFVHTGPETTAGRYLRRFWQPIYESSKLETGRAVRVRVLGEDFTLYRGESGDAHLVDVRCAHRGTLLSLGWVEQDDIRCYYHGWKYAPDGRCVEQPAEPKPFCNKVSIRAHPVREQLGLVFAWLGEGEVPPLPTWPEFEAESVSSIADLPCNYFQSAENIVDDAHVGFAHRAIGELSGSVRGYQQPDLSVEETSFGMTVFFGVEGRVESNFWIMPNICCIGYDIVFPRNGKPPLSFRARSLFWYVPIDDASHLHVMVTTPGSPLLLRGMRAENETPHDVAQQIRDILEGRSRAHHGGAPDEPKIPDLVRTQDGVSIVGQGTIVDRSREHLGASDAGVVLLRRIWRRELRRLEQGEEPTPFTRPDDLSDLLNPRTV